MSAEVAAARSVGLPFGFAEFALATPNGRPGWLTEVGNYLMSTGALFGTLFRSPGARQGNTSSLATWRSVVARSGVATPLPGPDTSPAPATPAPAATPEPTQTERPTPLHTTAPAGLVVTKAVVSPAMFTPTGKNHARIRFKLSQEASISVCVLNSKGTTVRQLASRDQPAAVRTGISAITSKEDCCQLGAIRS